jgi:hypothetical protein
MSGMKGMMHYRKVIKEMAVPQKTRVAFVEAVIGTNILSCEKAGFHLKGSQCGVILREEKRWDVYSMGILREERRKQNDYSN